MYIIHPPSFIITLTDNHCSKSECGDIGSLECVRLAVYADSCHSCVHCHASLCISPPPPRRKSPHSRTAARARVCRTKAARGQKSLSSNYRAQSHYQIVLFKRGPRCRIYFSAIKKLGGLLLMNPAKSLDGQPQEFVPSDMAAKTTYIMVDNVAFWRTGSGSRLPHDMLIARRKVLLANKKQ